MKLCSTQCAFNLFHDFHIFIFRKKVALNEVVTVNDSSTDPFAQHNKANARPKNHTSTAKHILVYYIHVLLYIPYYMKKRY